MYRFLKICHLVGLALFLGSVFGHIVASVAGGPPNAAGFLGARAEIVLATEALTLPGLALTLLSGAGMLAAAPGLRRQRWPWLHAGLGLAIAALAGTLIVPAGRHALTAAEALAAGDGNAAAALDSALRVETFAGACNIALAIVVVAIGVIRPKLRAGTARGPHPLADSGH